jgi:hypothetical protein
MENLVLGMLVGFVVCVVCLISFFKGFQIGRRLTNKNNGP